MLRLVFILEAAVDALFGIPLIVATGVLLSIYGMSTDASGTFLGQFLGAVFIGFGLLNWYARNWADSDAQRIVIRVNFVTTALGFLVALNFQLQPGAGVRSWAFVALTAAFGLAWGYFVAGTLRGGMPRPD